ncbi:glycosyl transferase family 90-domain-containing protein [Mrakia frigida]|uniref:glycosyl transferase family 90-domain-containing protein n=1 Tax=Mrakia frigida TaxID=29902 RepID=UPI003FCC0E26
MSRFLSSLLPSASYNPIDDLELSNSRSSPTSTRPAGPRRRLAPLVYLSLLHVAFVALVFKAWSHPPHGGPSGWSPYSSSHNGEDPAKLEWDMSPEGLAKFGVDAMYERQSTTLRQATARYELKTGRRTPRGFDKWFEWVSSRGLLVDEYDQIYNDFKPFYDLRSPHHIRATIQQDKALVEAGGTQMFAYESRDGRVRRTSAEGPFDAIWEDIMNKFAADVPSFDAIFNYQDEPRVVFNVRSPDARSRAWNLSDPKPYFLNPDPSADFFEKEGHCLYPNSDSGLFEATNKEDAFLISAVSQGFTTDLRPVISQTKISPCFADILTPSPYYYHREWWGPKEPYDDPDNIPWDEKAEKLYWRGSSSGGAVKGQNYHHMQRTRLLDLANARPDMIDAKFTRYVYCNEECDQMEKEYPLGEKQSWQHAYQYKYLFDIDGNTFSGRFIGLLMGGSLVFKSTIWQEFFTPWLKPYVHYVPVLPDLSDLYEKIEWAQRSPIEARRIALAGREMARRVITDDQLDAYTYAVMLELAEIQGGWELADGKKVVDVETGEQVGTQ